MKFLCPVLVIALSCGCSWQDVEFEASEQAKNLRFTQGHGLDKQFRWSLSPNAKVELAQKEQAHATQRAWNQAALAGLNRVFVARSKAAPIYRLLLDWPELDPSQSSSIQSGSVALLGINVLPEAAKQARVGVRVIDNGGLLLHHSELRIAEAFWGKSWHREETIEQAFQALAISLVGE